jgi:hypothetical protein
MTAAAIFLAALLIIAANFIFLGATSNRLAKIEAKIDGLRRALVEIGGRTASTGRCFNRVERPFLAGRETELTLTV